MTTTRNFRTSLRSSLSRWIATALSMCVVWLGVPQPSAGQHRSVTRYLSPNGFELRAEVRDGATPAARPIAMEFESPWGERMDLVVEDISAAAGRPGIRFTFAEGVVLELTQDGPDDYTMLARVGDELRVGRVGDVPEALQRALLEGRPDHELRAILEDSPHWLVAEAMSHLHSPQFFEELARFEMMTQANCFSATMGCLAGITGTTIAFGAVMSACVFGSTFTFGSVFVACVIALVGLNVAKIPTMWACILAGGECGNGTLEDPVETLTSPILIDLDRNGFHLSAGPVLFDIDGNGQKELLAWTDPGELDAFLVHDANGNGLVDNGHELFGNHTPLVNGGTGLNGYVALAEYDLPANGGNGDGLISASDRIFDRLAVWTDLNQNGISEDGEVRSLSDARVASVATYFRQTPRVDEHGNELRYVSEAMLERNGRLMRTLTTDVFFSVYYTEIDGASSPSV